MQVESSLYLKKVKPALQELLEGLLKKYGYASILAADSKVSFTTFPGGGRLLPKMIF